MPDKIKEDDLKNLFNDLEKAIIKKDTEDFIKTMKKEKDKFNMKIDSYFAFGNTLNHSIARAVNDNYCNNKKIERCNLCIRKNAEFTILGITKNTIIRYGENPFKILQFILNNEDVKTEYKNLFKDSYNTIKNDKGKTPNDFAKTCNINLYNLMTSDDGNVGDNGDDNGDVGDNDNVNNDDGNNGDDNIDNNDDGNNGNNDGNNGNNDGNVGNNGDDNQIVNRITGAEKENIQTWFGTSYVKIPFMGGGKRKSRKTRKPRKTRKSKKSRKSSQKKKQRRSHRR